MNIKIQTAAVLIFVGYFWGRSLGESSAASFPINFPRSDSIFHSDHSVQCPVILTRIVITVLTSSATAKLRVPLLRSVFAQFNCSFQIVYFSDKLDFGKTQNYVASPCSDGQTNGLCCKTAFAYQYAMEHFPDLDWVVRITDDTFLHLENLATFLSHFDPSKKWYLGEKYERDGLIYADGGAGWIISRPVLQAIYRDLGQILPSQGQVCYDDVFFGSWMRLKKIAPLRQASGFHNEFFRIDESAGTLSIIPIHSFHNKHKQISHKPIAFHLRCAYESLTYFLFIYSVKFFIYSELETKQEIPICNMHRLTYRRFKL
jgi:hypothetical protein